MGDVKPKRSIIYDEIGDRLGKGRKGGNRSEVRTPPGISQTTKKVALERAKSLVVHRHFAEMVKIFNAEADFLKALDEWYEQVFPGTNKPSESGVEMLLSITRHYYKEHELDKHEDHTMADGSVEIPMLMADGRQRPRPKKKAS